MNITLNAYVQKINILLIKKNKFTLNTPYLLKLLYNSENQCYKLTRFFEDGHQEDLNKYWELPEDMEYYLKGMLRGLML